MQYLEFLKILYGLQVNLYYTAVSTLEIKDALNRITWHKVPLPFPHYCHLTQQSQADTNSLSWEMVWDHINSWTMLRIVSTCPSKKPF